MRIAILPDGNNTPLALRTVGTDAQVVAIIRSVVGGATNPETADNLLDLMIALTEAAIRAAARNQAGAAEKQAAEEAAEEEFNDSWVVT